MYHLLCIARLTGVDAKVDAINSPHRQKDGQRIVLSEGVRDARSNAVGRLTAEDPRLVNTPAN